MQPRDARIEAHHAEAAGIIRKARSQRRAPSARCRRSIFTSSSSGTRPATRVSRLSSVGIGWPPTLQPAELRQRRFADPHRAAAHPPGVGSWKTTIWLSAVRRRSHSIPAPSSSAAAKATRLFSGNCDPSCSPRWANPAGPGQGDQNRGSGADRDDRIHFDGHAQRKNRDPDRAAGMASGLAEHLLHQLRSAVGDLGLVGEMRARCSRTRPA